MMKTLEPVLIETIITSRVAPWRSKLPWFFPARRESNRLSRVLFETTRSLIEDCRAKLDSGHLSADTIIHGLLTMRHPKTGEPLKNEHLVAETLMWLIAGMDTTSMQVSWCLYALSQHPEVERKVLREIDAVLGPPGGEGENHGGNKRELTYDDLGGMTYLAAVLRETMRRDAF